MVDAVAFPAPLSPDLAAKVAALSKVLDRPPAWIIEHAVADFVALQEWQLAAIDEGLRAAEAGLLIAHEDVAAWAQSWGKPDELPMPSCG